jgi:hypothetical protein
MAVLSVLEFLAADKLHGSFVGSRLLRVRLRFLRMTAKINIKGNGQECPFHTSKVKSSL